MVSQKKERKKKWTSGELNVKWIKVIIWLDKEIKSRKLKEKGFNENGLEKNKERNG